MGGSIPVGGPDPDVRPATPVASVHGPPLPPAVTPPEGYVTSLLAPPMILDLSIAESLDRPRRGSLGLFLSIGLRVAFLYCLVGVGNELLRSRLPFSITRSIADAVYGLPTNLLGRLGLAEPIAHAALLGRVPTWIAAAAAPTLGVALILLACFAAWGIWALLALVASLKQR